MKGYKGDGIKENFTNGIKTLVDLKPENIGIDKQDRIRFIDVDSFLN